MRRHLFAISILLTASPILMAPDDPPCDVCDEVFASELLQDDEIAIYVFQAQRGSSYEVWLLPLAGDPDLHVGDGPIAALDGQGCHPRAPDLLQESCVIASAQTGPHEIIVHGDRGQSSFDLYVAELPEGRP